MWIKRMFFVYSNVGGVRKRAIRVAWHCSSNDTLYFAVDAFLFASTTSSIQRYIFHNACRTSFERPTTVLRSASFSTFVSPQCRAARTAIRREEEENC